MNVPGAVLLVGSVLAASGPSRALAAEAAPAATARDFFVYACEREYRALHSIPQYDGSQAYAVENVDAGPELLTSLFDTAKEVAASLPAPDYTDAEHGAPAVLRRCQVESQGERVNALLPQQHADVARDIRARLDAYRDRDTVAWASYVDDACVCSTETKASILAAIENRPASVKLSYGEIRELTTRMHGDVAIARYRIAETSDVDGKRQTGEAWRTETYAWRGDRWVLLAGAEAVIAPDPEPIVVAQGILATLVGRYEYTPGSVDVVTLENGRLFVTPSGEARVELFAESADTYFAKGQPWRLVFSRDAAGAVTGIAFRQGGQEYAGRRLK